MYAAIVTCNLGLNLPVSDLKIGEMIRLDGIYFEFIQSVAEMLSCVEVYNDILRVHLCSFVDSERFVLYDFSGAGDRL